METDFGREELDPAILDSEELRMIIEEAQLTGFIERETLQAAIKELYLKPEEEQALNGYLNSLGVEIDQEMDQKTAVSAPDSTSRETLKRHEVVALAKRIEQGDPRARERMIEANLGLVRNVAYSYRRKSRVDVEDLVQDGTIGLMKAVESFDYRRGVAFSTYAMPKIKHEILLAMTKKEDNIRKPGDVVAIRKRLLAVHPDLMVKLKKEPTIEQLAKDANVDLEAARNAWEAPEASLSLNASDSTGAEYIDHVADETVEHPLFKPLEDQQKAATWHVLAELPTRERQVIELRLGLNGDQPKTQQEIGDIFGITQERVRQIYGQALNRLSLDDSTRTALGLEAPAPEAAAPEEPESTLALEEKTTLGARTPVELTDEEIEAEVQDMLSRGFSNDRIAQELGTETTKVLQKKRTVVKEPPPIAIEAKIADLAYRELRNWQIGRRLGMTAIEVHKIRKAMLGELSQEEIEVRVVSLISSGHSNKEIGASLAVSVPEVRETKHTIARKFGIKPEELPEIAAGILIWLGQEDT